MIECQHLIKKFRNGDEESTVIDNVSLTVGKGEFVALTGQSGSGKSTLMNMIGLIDIPDSGTIRLSDQDTGTLNDEQRAACRNRLIGYIFQSFYLENRYTVEKNVEIPLLIADVPKAERAIRIQKCLEYVNLSHKSNQLAETLSGGEKQRISIARAIMKDAPIIILDEATANVDPENERDLMSAIKELTKEKTVIMIAHRLKTVRNADQIVVIDKGKIVEQGKHEELVKFGGIYARFIDSRKQAVSWKL